MQPQTFATRDETDDTHMRPQGGTVSLTPAQRACLLLLVNRRRFDVEHALQLGFWRQENTARRLRDTHAADCAELADLVALADALRK